MKRGCDLLIFNLLKTRSKDRSLVSLDSSYQSYQSYSSYQFLQRRAVVL